jgi:hypothetical protein
MSLNQSTLIEFERARYESGTIPPEGSNSFYEIGDGQINLLTLRDYTDNYRFNLFTDKGTVHTGDGTFYVSGNIYDVSRPYDKLTVIQNTKLIIDDTLDISKGTVEVHGTLEFVSGSTLNMSKGASLILYPDSTLIIADDTNINIVGTSEITIYGQVDVHISKVYSLIDNDKVTIDSAAVMNVTGIDLPNRPTSMTDYDAQLRDRVITVYTQGSTITSIGEIGYVWRAGTPLNSSQVIRMETITGDSVLGDFKLSVLGMPATDISDLQIISEVVVKAGTTMYISEKYGNSQFIRPELYLGVVIGNNTTPGKCIVYGDLVVDGENASIALDRGGMLYVEQGATLTLKNGASIKSTYNEHDRVMFINGTVTIDTLDQINTLDTGNIYFGDTGKLIVLNPDPGYQKTLFSTPNGIHNSDLYRLFEDNIQHIEFHINHNTGIEIDEYMEHYSKDMRDWYGGMRIEKAIHDGLLVWHDGGFIRLDQKYIPWVDKHCNLYNAASLFKTTESDDADILQDVVNRLQYAGCGDINFIFKYGSYYHEITLTLSDVKMKSAYAYPLTNVYQLSTNSTGQLFMRNQIQNANINSIISSKSTVINIDSTDSTFAFE